MLPIMSTCNLDFFFFNLYTITPQKPWAHKHTNSHTHLHILNNKTLCTCTKRCLLDWKKPPPPPKQKKKKIRKKNKFLACQHIFLAWQLIYVDLREKYVDMREKCWHATYLCQHALINVEMQDIYSMLTCNLSLSTSCTWTHWSRMSISQVAC